MRKSSLGFLFFLMSQTAAFTQQADIILNKGKIFTADTANRYVQALAIKGNKILEVGTTAEVLKLAGASTRIIDLAGKTVLPGFNDAHAHLGWSTPVGHSFTSEFSVPGPGRSVLLNSLNVLIKKAKPGEWLQGDIGLTVFNDTSIRRRLLDSIAPANPLVLQLMWGHGLVANTSALRAVGIADSANDPLAGWYERLPGSKHLSGAMYEYAQFPFWQARAVADPVNLVRGLRATAMEQLRYGITTVQDMSSSLQGTAARIIFREADLPLRTRIIAMPATTERGRSLAEWNHDKIWNAGLAYISGIKYMIDGTSLEQTAMMTKPYPGRKGWYGRLDFPEDTIRQILKDALHTDRQLMMHIVGDSSTIVVLKLMQEMASAAEWKRRRVRIEHGNGLNTRTMQQVRALGIVITHTPKVGKRNRLRTIMDMGITVAIAPDDLVNPFVNILIVTTQQADSSQNITREQAVIAYTRGSAYAEFAESQKGTLAKGMLADITVLSQDIFTVPAEQLPGTRSLLTIVDGKIVYSEME